MRRGHASCRSVALSLILLIPQILSTLIAALGVDDTAKDSLDFGTLHVYTCTATCDPPPDGYALELAVHQPFAADGVDLGSGPAGTA